MNLSKINFDDVLNAQKQIENGSVKEFLNEIISRRKEIEYIQDSMILYVVYTSDTLKMKDGSLFKEKEMIVKRNISKEEISDKLKELLFDFTLSSDRPKHIDSTDWYNFQKEYYKTIEIDNILKFFNEDCNYNCYKLMSKENPFGVSVRLSPMRENINLMTPRPTR
jgi:hypothetical protein